jgi:hypothetical protein
VDNNFQKAIKPKRKMTAMMYSIPFVKVTKSMMEFIFVSIKQSMIEFIGSPFFLGVACGARLSTGRINTSACSSFDSLRPAFPQGG